MNKQKLDEEAAKELFEERLNELHKANISVEALIDIVHKKNAGLSHEMADRLVKLYTEEFRYW